MNNQKGKIKLNLIDIFILLVYYYYRIVVFSTMRMSPIFNGSRKFSTNTDLKFHLLRHKKLINKIKYFITKMEFYMSSQ